jgi:hypothetical protein
VSDEKQLEIEEERLELERRRVRVEERLLELEEWRGKFDRHCHMDGKHGRFHDTSFNAVISYSLAAIRGTVLLNGGGAVALLAFMAEFSKAQCVDLSGPLRLFVFGAVLAVLSAGTSYIGQTFFTFNAGSSWLNAVAPSKEAENKAFAWGAGGIVCQVVGMALVAAAIVCFWEGCHQAFELLQGAPQVCPPAA